MRIAYRHGLADRRAAIAVARTWPRGSEPEAVYEGDPRRGDIVAVKWRGVWRRGIVPGTGRGLLLAYESQLDPNQKVRERRYAPEVAEVFEARYGVRSKHSKEVLVDLPMEEQVAVYYIDLRERTQYRIVERARG